MTVKDILHCEELISIAYCGEGEKESEEPSRKYVLPLPRTIDQNPTRITRTTTHLPLNIFSNSYPTPQKHKHTSQIHGLGRITTLLPPSCIMKRLMPCLPLPNWPDPRSYSALLCSVEVDRLSHDVVYALRNGGI